MRQASQTGTERPWLLWIIGVVLAGSVLQILLQVWFANVSFWADWVVLSPANLLAGKVWTLFTYVLGCRGLLDLVFNLITIYFIGRVLGQQVSQRHILISFLLAVVLGGAVWTAVNIAAPQALLIGSTTGMIGLLTLFCTLNANQRMTLMLFFVLPVTLKPKWIAWAMVALNGFGLLFNELPRAFGISEGMAMGPVAFSAYLTAILVGFLYARYLQKPVPIRSGVRVEVPEWMRRKRQTAAARYTVNVSSARSSAAPASGAASASAVPTAAEVDRVLDKINQEGFGSLTPEERQVLERAGGRSRR